MRQRLFGGLRRGVTRLTLSPLRAVGYILHATGLEHIYKPRFMRSAVLAEITDDLVARLPKYCYSLTGAQMDPMNLVFIGAEADLKRTFKQAGWKRANPASPLHLIYGLMTTITKRSYETGPFTPLYVNIALQDLAFQHSTPSKNFSQRHHIRVWRTGIVLPENLTVWVGAASYDTSLKIQLRPPFVHHRIDPDLDQERTFVAHSLEKVGSIKLKVVPMTPPSSKKDSAENAYGAEYFTDGRAVVIEL